MTQERDDYMRRQEADHALLDMRTRTGRGPSCGPNIQHNVPRTLEFAAIRAGVVEQIERDGSFEWKTGGSSPSPRDRIVTILRQHGVEDACIASALPSLCSVVDEVAALEYHRGERDGVSRTRNRPGDGDMGG